MLQATLDSAPNIKTYGRCVDRKKVEAIQEHNSAVYGEIISNAFDGRNTSCHISPSTFWVYANSLEEVDEVKHIAKTLGYKNMRSFRPWSSDENDNRIDDPKGLFAVDISKSTELIIGDTARSFVKFIEPITDTFIDNIMNTYAHMGTIILRVDALNIATQLKESLTAYFAIGKGVTTLSFDVVIREESLDCWEVVIKTAHLTQNEE